MSATPRQLLAASAAGVVSTVCDVAVLATLIHHGAPVAAAAFAGAGVGATTCFVINKHVAFADHSSVDSRQLARFAGVALIGAMLLALTMQLVAVELGVPYLIAKIVCAAVVFALWSFPAQRRFVFAAARTR